MKTTFFAVLMCLLGFLSNAFGQAELDQGDQRVYIQEGITVVEMLEVLDISSAKLQATPINYMYWLNCKKDDELKYSKVALQIIDDIRTRMKLEIVGAELPANLKSLY